MRAHVRISVLSSHSLPLYAILFPFLLAYCKDLVGNGHTKKLWSIIPSSIPWKDYPRKGDQGPTLLLCHEVKPLHQFCSHAYYPADFSSFFSKLLSCPETGEHQV